MMVLMDCHLGTTIASCKIGRDISGWVLKKVCVVMMG